MNKKFFGSLALAGVVTTTVNAASLTAFGHIGTAYASKSYASAVGRVGFEVGLGSLSLGLGAAGGIPYAIFRDDAYKSHIRHNVFHAPGGKRWFNWFSDAYLRVDTAYLSVVGGRYDTTVFFRGQDNKAHTGVDWFSGLNEGVSFKVDTRNFGWWGIYSYEAMDFGHKNPTRLGSDLMGYRQYSLSGQYVSTGFDINLQDSVFLDPFVNYSIGRKYLQAGAKFQVNLGKGILKSKSIFRGMYQRAEYSNGTLNTTLLWVDQEFLVNNLLKFGAGGYYVGKNDRIITQFGESTRFYGATFGREVNYFAPGSGIWYVFAGVEHKYFLFDFLYSWKDGARRADVYQEISAIAQVNLYQTRKTQLGVGGGWVRSASLSQGVAFVKLSF